MRLLTVCKYHRFQKFKSGNWIQNFICLILYLTKSNHHHYVIGPSRLTLRDRWTAQVSECEAWISPIRFKISILRTSQAMCRRRLRPRGPIWTPSQVTAIQTLANGLPLTCILKLMRWFQAPITRHRSQEVHRSWITKPSCRPFWDRPTQIKQLLESSQPLPCKTTRYLFMPNSKFLTRSTPRMQVPMEMEGGETTMTATRNRLWMKNKWMICKLIIPVWVTQVNQMNSLERQIMAIITK